MPAAARALVDDEALDPRLPSFHEAIFHADRRPTERARIAVRDEDGPIGVASLDAPH